MKPSSQVVQGSSIRHGPHLEHIWTSLGPLASRGGMHEAAMTQRAQESKGEEMKETKVCHPTWVGDCPEASWPDKGRTLQIPGWNQSGRAKSTSDILGQSHYLRGTHSNGDRAGPWCDVVGWKRGVVRIGLTRKNIERGTKASDSKPHPQPPASDINVYSCWGIPQPLPVSFRSPYTAHSTTWNSTLQG